MYHWAVRYQARLLFKALSEGDAAAVLARTASDVHHVFPGDHALGGERHTKAAVARWFERLDRLFPEHEFEVKQVIARGWPWSTWVAIQWRARLTPAKGQPYLNDGAHLIHLRWGKTTYIHAYLDTQRVVDACRTMAELGVEEAGAQPILS